MPTKVSSWMVASSRFSRSLRGPPWSGFVSAAGAAKVGGVAAGVLRTAAGRNLWRDHRPDANTAEKIRVTSVQYKLQTSSEKAHS